MIIKTGNILKVVKTKYENTSFISLIYKMLLIISGALIPVFIFVENFNIEVDRLILVITGVLGTILFSVIIGARKPKYLILFLITLLTVVWAFYFRENLQSGIISIANNILTRYNTYFNKNIEMFKFTDKNVKYANTMVISVAVFELTFVLVAGSWYRVRGWLHIFIATVFVGCGMLLGIMPSAWKSILLIAYLFAVILADRIHKKNKKIIGCKNIASINDNINLRAGIISIMVVLLVNFMLIAFINPTGYSRDKEIEKIDKFISKKISEIKTIELFKGGPFSGNKANGGIADGKLGQIGTLKYTGETAMYITVPKNSNGFYLRGFVGDQYCGDRWEGLDRAGITYYQQYLDKGESWLSYTYNILNEEAYRNEEFASIYEGRLNSRMLIELVGANSGYHYTPYFSKVSSWDSNYDMRVLIEPDEERDILFADYVLDDNNEYPNYEANSFTMEEYEHFVYRYYQHDWKEQVSNDIINEFEPGQGKAQLSQYNGANLADCINEVKTYLSENMEYTLSPGKLNDGQDFLDEFVFIKKKGYCSYFASAATIMFRAQGIPARYVEGYIVVEEDYKKNVVKNEKVEQIINLKGDKELVDYVKLDIKDYRAHAWTEIYVSGFGWVPVEVTTGYTNMLAGEQPTTKPQQETTTKSQEQTTTKSKQEQTTTKGNVSGQEMSRDIDYKLIFRVIGIMLFTIIFILVITYVIKMRFRKTMDKLNQDDNFKAIEAAYKYSDKINKIVGIKFSNSLLTEDKAKIMSDNLGGEISRYITWFKIYDKFNYCGNQSSFSEKEKEFVIDTLYDNVKRANERIALIKKLQIKYIYGLKEKNSL